MLRAAPFAALSLAACASIGAYPYTYYPDVTSAYTVQEAHVFAASGGPVEVLGAPADGASPEAVAAAMRLPAFLRSRSLTARPPTEARYKGLRLVLVFAPSSNFTGDAACAGGASGGVAAGAETRVKGVFCRNDRALSESTVVAEGAPGVGDPALSRALGLLVNSVMPSTAPEDADQDPIWIRRN